MVREHVKSKEDWIHTVEMLDDSRGMVSRVYKHLGTGAHRFMITEKNTLETKGQKRCVVTYCSSSRC